MRCFLIMALTLASAGVACGQDSERSTLTPKEAAEGFVSLFDGKSFDGWQGAVDGYTIENGTMVCRSSGDLFTKKEYADFVIRFEFKLPRGGNNGVSIRSPLHSDMLTAYSGMEIQIIDNDDPQYKGLQPYQFHGSVYGVAPAKKVSMKPIGEWNCEEIVADHSRIKVTLNDAVINDVDLSNIQKTIDGHEHPGLHNVKGYVGWAGHGDPVAFRNVRIKELPASVDKRTDLRAKSK